MLIDRQHYLDLLRKVQILNQQNIVLRRENQIFSQQLQNQKYTNCELMQKFAEMEQYISSLNEKIIGQNTVLHHDLKGHMIQINQRQRKYLDEQFQNLEKSSFQKYKLLQIKNTVKRMENHQLLQFCQKVKKVYKTTTKIQKQPSLKDLIKWIKQNTSKRQQSTKNYQIVKENTKQPNETASSWKTGKQK